MVRQLSHWEKMRIYFYLFLLLFSSSQLHAQENDKFKKQLKIKSPTPAIQEDTLIREPEEIKQESPQAEPESEMDNANFQPKKDLSIVSEDTTSIDEGVLSVVEVSEELKIDSVWVKVAEYYAIWDSRNVNPYKIDPTKFEDTVVINLYDEAKNQLWSAPLGSSQITSNFGMRGYRWHYGTDLELDTGDPVKAAFDGIVRIVRYDARGWGNFIVVRHYNGLETLYAHLSKQSVEVGQMVKAGDVLGLGGSTGRSSGPHLHYEVRYQGNAINPVSIYNFNENNLIAPVFTLTPRHFAYFGSKNAMVRRTAYHTIRRGDTLGGIARRYGVSVSYLTRINKISTRTKLQVGRRLRVK